MPCSFCREVMTLLVFHNGTASLIDALMYYLDRLAYLAFRHLLADPPAKA